MCRTQSEKVFIVFFCVDRNAVAARRRLIEFVKNIESTRGVGIERRIVRLIGSRAVCADDDALFLCKADIVAPLASHCRKEFIFRFCQIDKRRIGRLNIGFRFDDRQFFRSGLLLQLCDKKIARRYRIKIEGGIEAYTKRVLGEKAF